MSSDWPGTARKVVFVGTGARISEYPLKGPGPGEILIRTHCSLISVGTETTLLVSDRWSQPDQPADPAASPESDDDWSFDNYSGGDHWDMEGNRRYPGYAVSGHIVTTGHGVRGLSAGDRVVALHHHADYAVCSSHPSITLPIPDGVSDADAAYTVLGSVALHAVNRANLKLGESVAVFGAGVVGQLVVQLAKMNGASPVIAVDLSDERLELAERLGADSVVNSTRSDPAGHIRGCTSGRGTDCTIEAVGNPAVLQSCMRSTAVGGRVVVMGAIVGPVELDMYSEFIFRELTLIAAQQPRNPVQDTIYYHQTAQRNRRLILDLIRTGRLNVQQLTTHRFSAEQAPRVYEALAAAKNADYDGAGGVNRDMVGVVLDWNPPEPTG